MMKLGRWLVFSIVLLSLSSAYADSEQQWQFTLTPVLWNASVSASLTEDGSSGEQPINPDYRFFSLDNLDGYLSLQFEARNDRFSILFDSLRARYQDQTDRNFINLSIATELGFVELDVAYQLTEKIRLDLIGGVRNSFLDVDTVLTPGPTNSRSFSWTDPVIGLRYNYVMTDSWQLWLRGDVGGFDVSTQRMLNAVADIQYLLNDYVSFIVGYRYLQIDFKEDDFLYDVNLKGVHLAVGIHF